MDKKISQEIIKKRRRKLIIQLSIVLGITIIVYFVLANLLRSGISHEDLYTSVVDRGLIEITISATGKVVPLSEEIIISPVSSKILEVYQKVGGVVREGDTILKLDLAVIDTEIEKLDNELKMRQYRLEQQRVTSESSLSDILMQVEIDEMRIMRMEVLLKNEIFLDSIGAGTSDKIKQAELELSVEKLRLEQLRTKYENQKRIVAADTRVMELDYHIALSNFALTNKTLSEAQVLTPRTATLTWVNDQIGSSVIAGAQIAIISDLTHYKIEAEISESYGNKVLLGSNVIVRSSNKELRGTVANLVPSVRNGMINFTVLLEDNNNEILRSGLRVDVYVVNAVSENVLRIANRSYYTRPGEYDLWVIENNKAIKRKVFLGESNFDYVEVKDGLEEDEIVIISDMGKYIDKLSLKIRK